MVSRIFLIAVGLQIAVWIAVWFDLPLLRQTIGFLYLTFLPGILLLRATGFRRTSLAVEVPVGVGLSLTILMMVGFLIDETVPTDSLNLLTLLGATSVVTLSLAAIVELRSRSKESGLGALPKPSAQDFLLAAVVTLGVFAALFMRYWGSNLFLLSSLLVVSGVVVLLGIDTHWRERWHYAVAVVSIAFTLILGTTLASNFLTGWDITAEFYVAETTIMTQHWNPLTSLGPSGGVSNYNAMMSVTILPAIYTQILNLNLLYVFTLIYPAIFALVPLVLYDAYREQIGPRRAFLAAFFFMSFAAFFGEIPFLARQMIGEFFLALLILLEFSKNWTTRSKRILTIVFIAALVVSHYSVAYFYFFLLGFSILVNAVGSRISNRWRSVSHGYSFSLFLVILIAWYLFVSSGSALASLVNIGQNVANGISSDFFGLAGREPVVLTTTVGPGVAVAHRLSRAVFLLSVFFMAIGFLRSISRRENGFSWDYLAYATVCFIIICASVVLPNLASGLNLSRIYQLGLFLTAPFCITGAELIISRIARVFHAVRLSRHNFNRAGHVLLSLLVVVFLITYFLLQSGLAYEVLHESPSSITLTSDKSRFINTGNIGAYDANTLPEDAIAASWLSSSFPNSSIVFCDVGSRQVLYSYGLMSPQAARIIDPPGKSLLPGTVLYLRELNVVQEIWEFNNATSRIDHASLAEGANIVYSNGNAQVLATVSRTKIPISLENASLSSGTGIRMKGLLLSGPSEHAPAFSSMPSPIRAVTIGALIASICPTVGLILWVLFRRT